MSRRGFKRVWRRHHEKYMIGETREAASERANVLPWRSHLNIEDGHDLRTRLII